jgi:hypothetical protein
VTFPVHEVPEVAQLLASLRTAEPVTHGALAVVPLLAPNLDDPDWLTLEDLIPPSPLWGEGRVRGEAGARTRGNPERFPADFMFRLATVEAAALRSQTVISNVGRGGHRYLACFEAQRDPDRKEVRAWLTKAGLALLRHDSSYRAAGACGQGGQPGQPVTTGPGMNVSANVRGRGRVGLASALR